MNIEHEQKGLITEKEFNDLLKCNDVSHIIEQANYYFETDDDALFQQGAALRVRIKPDFAELTVKQKYNGSNKEYNFPLSIEIAEQIINDGLIPDTIALPISLNAPLTKQLVIKTARHHIAFNKHVIEIDKTSFNDVIDFEIEVEAESLELAGDVFSEFCQKNNVVPTASAPKIKRFLDYNNNKWNQL